METDRVIRLGLWLRGPFRSASDGYVSLFKRITLPNDDTGPEPSMVQGGHRYRCRWTKPLFSGQYLRKKDCKRGKIRAKKPVQLLNQLGKPLERLFDPKSIRGFKENPKKTKNSRSIRFGYIGRLGPFRAIGNLELYLLSCTKRFKALPRNPRIVNKHIVPTRLFDKSISLLGIKPFHNPFSQLLALLFKTVFTLLRRKPRVLNPG